MMIIMRKWVWVILLAAVNSQCYNACSSCFANSPSPYACSSCHVPTHLYAFSCDNAFTGDGSFIAFAVVVILIYLFMLAIGYGMYRDLFEGIQLTTLVSWRSGFLASAAPFQATNLALVQSNSFPDTIGGQFIAIMVVLFIFWILLFLVDKIAHSPTAILIKRKRLIFPTRIFSFFFSILLFASLLQVTTFSIEPIPNYFALTLAILALIKLLFVTIGLVVACNTKSFHSSDPAYYVFVDQLTSKRWYARNNLLFSLLARTITIVSFIFGFGSPKVVGIIMIFSQGSYALFTIGLLRFTKIRYYLINSLGNIMVTAIIVLSYLGSNQPIGSTAWQLYSYIFMVLVMSLAGLCLFVHLIEIFIRKDQIFKLLKSFAHRFILCRTTQTQLQITKFESDSHQHKVLSFKKNLIFNRELQMSSNQQQSVE